MAKVRTIAERKKDLERKLEQLKLREEIEEKRKKLREMRGRK